MRISDMRKLYPMSLSFYNHSPEAWRPARHSSETRDLHQVPEGTLGNCTTCNLEHLSAAQKQKTQMIPHLGSSLIRKRLLSYNFHFDLVLHFFVKVKNCVVSTQLLRAFFQHNFLAIDVKTFCFQCIGNLKCCYSTKDLS